METREEWLAWRHKGIGSSDAAAILGLSPWKTKLQLFNEKIQAEPEKERSSYITDKGNEFEPKVRSLYETLTGESFAPALCALETHPFMRASLDGRSVDKKLIIEIKLSGREDWEGAKAGKVPEKYMPQIQHQLMVSGADKCIYLSYLYEKGAKSVTSEKLATVDVYPDLAFQEKLFKAEMDFWAGVESKKAPEAGPDDYKVLRAAGMTDKVKNWKDTKAKIDQLTEHLEVLREEILAEAEKMDHDRVRCLDVNMVKVTKVGAVQYKNIPELKGVNLDAYRGKSSTSWRMEISKEKE